MWNLWHQWLVNWQGLNKKLRHPSFNSNTERSTDTTHKDKITVNSGDGTGYVTTKEIYFFRITQYGAAISVRQRSKDIEFGKLSILQNDPMHWTLLFIHVV